MKIHPLFILCICISLISIGCDSRKKNTTQINTSNVILPFELTAYNNIKLKTILNGTDSLDLKFDTGTTGLLLTHKAIKEKTRLLNDGKENTPTQNYVKLNALASLEIGSLTWDSLEVYPVRHSGQGTDGRFGWDLFENKIVIIDYDSMTITIQEELPDVKTFTKTKLVKTKTVFCIEGQMNVHDQEYKGRFMIDTGYQKTLLLDSTIIAEQAFPKDLPVIKTNQLRNGAGDVFITKVIEVPELNIGEQTLQKVPTQILNQSNPAGFSTHILGNEVLKRFNTVLDFKNGDIYFQKNTLIDQKYNDAQK